ncbi:DUF1653 domain-containing protein [Streptomyces rubiginosohelvolus]|uniref:DUF1653 domain-containing protein n=1 Tax=Streptomyces rubiginosohelvolus TaxID=67362 RepID=UPI0033A9E59D
MTDRGVAFREKGRHIDAGVYRHYKGNLYRVLHVAQHSETAEQLVVYQELQGRRAVWARPLEMFKETVNTPSGPQRRFSPVEEGCA